MNIIEHQHQCSSKLLINNNSIFSKLRQSVLIIDIEPTVDKNHKYKDKSSESVVNDYLPDCKYLFLSENSTLYAIK